MQNYLKLLSFLKYHKRVFFLAVLFMGLGTLLEGVSFSLMVPMMDRILTKKKIIIPNEIPDFLAQIVDKLNATDPATLLWVIPMAFLGVLLIKQVVTFWYGYFMNDVSQRVIRDVRDRVYKKIQSLSLDYFSQKRTGELVARITNDVQVVENAVSYGVTDLFRQTFTILMFITIIFLIYVKAAVILFIIFPLIGVPMAQIGRRLKKLSRSSQEKMADINSLLLETISGVKVVKAFCTEDYEEKRFKEQNSAFYKLRMKTIKRLLFIGPMTEFAGTMCGMIIFLWLGHQVMNEELSVGVFALFFGSFMAIISPIKKLGNVNALTQQALAANERIYDVLDSQPTVEENPRAKVLPTIQKNIKIDNMSFHYDEESGTVLHNINLEIKVGELVAIVGPTGSGKSTLANLIPRFYDPTSGTISIDGTNLRDVTFKSLREQIGIVAQETILFNDTVKANISYGREDVSQQEVEAAALKAFAHRFIIKMPKGYDTIVGDRGFRLSGGEKQRISIARAILKNPPTLILDEATSQLDSESEKFVQEALDKLMQGRTVICIAHRLSTIKRATRILVLDQGKVVGLAPHETLLQECPLYKRLYETQFQM